MPQDAGRLNRQQIREQEQLNRERRAQDEADERRRSEAMKRSKEQYGHVKSHGYGSVAGRPRGASGDDAEIRVYVRECDADNARSYTYMESDGIAEAAAVHAGNRQPQLPSVTRTTRMSSTGAAGAARAAPAPSSSAATSAAASAMAPNKGRVPRYLQQRKAELAAEKDAIEAEAVRQQELAKIPAGHRLVSEEEKAETLASLEARRTELEVQLGKIPIRFDTQAIRTRRQNIEDELRQIETTKIKYSTKKPLYVPLC